MTIIENFSRKTLNENNCFEVLNNNFIHRLNNKELNLKYLKDVPNVYKRDLSNNLNLIKMKYINYNTNNTNNFNQNNTQSCFYNTNINNKYIYSSKNNNQNKRRNSNNYFSNSINNNYSDMSRYLNNNFFINNNKTNNNSFNPFYNNRINNIIIKKQNIPYNVINWNLLLDKKIPLNKCKGQNQLITDKLKLNQINQNKKYKTQKEFFSKKNCIFKKENEIIKKSSLINDKHIKLSKNDFKNIDLLLEKNILKSNNVNNIKKDKKNISNLLINKNEDIKNNKCLINNINFNTLNHYNNNNNNNCKEVFNIDLNKKDNLKDLTNKIAVNRNIIENSDTKFIIKNKSCDSILKSNQNNKPDVISENKLENLQIKYNEKDNNINKDKEFDSMFKRILDRNIKENEAKNNHLFLNSTYFNNKINYKKTKSDNKLFNITFNNNFEKNKFNSNKFTINNNIHKKFNMSKASNIEFTLDKNEIYSWNMHENIWKDIYINENNINTQLSACVNISKINDLNIKYLIPPNEQDIFLANYYFSYGCINNKVIININNIDDEIKKLKETYKKVMIRWHPDKLIPVLKKLKLEEDYLNKIVKKTFSIIDNISIIFNLIIKKLKKSSNNSLLK